MIEFKKNYENDKRSSQEQRSEVMNWCKGWDNYQSHVMQEACRDADITARTIIKKRSKGGKCEFSFRSKRDSVQGFNIQKLSLKSIYPRFLGGVYFTETIPEYAKGKTARVITENGCWWLCCYDTREIPITRELREVCALDCGVRTFQTVYSNKEVAELGKEYFKDKLLPLYLELDKLISKSKLQNNLKIDNQRNSDLLRYYEKKINKLRLRIKNLVEDLHKKCANYLTNEFDIILLPTFETQKMSKIGNRKLNNKSVRSMIGLSHYKFKQTLKWQALKKGKIVLDVNESFTSKTNPFTGEVMNIGSSKTFTYQGKVYDRDINGARNIFIKNTLR
jgi:putative transposase